jgi:hypothetical protein
MSVPRSRPLESPRIGSTDVDVSICIRVRSPLQRAKHALPAAAPCDCSPFPLDVDTGQDTAVCLGKGLTWDEGAEYPLDLEAFHAVVPHEEVEFAAPQPLAQAAGGGRKHLPAKLW